MCFQTKRQQPKQPSKWNIQTLSLIARPAWPSCSYIFRNPIILDCSPIHVNTRAFIWENRFKKKINDESVKCLWFCDVLLSDDGQWLSNCAFKILQKVTNEYFYFPTSSSGFSLYEVLVHNLILVSFSPAAP